MKLNLKQKLGMTGTLAAAALLLTVATPAVAAGTQAWTWDAAERYAMVKVSTYQRMPSPDPKKMTGHRIEFEALDRPGVHGAAWVFCSAEIASCTGSDFEPGAILLARPTHFKSVAGEFQPDIFFSCFQSPRVPGHANCHGLGAIAPAPGDGQ